ncbi:birA, biotin-[acetyl-CoA-carboxylase] ligase region [Longilinea arvoryzae]|uniref:biotin--[biotin carboxyl-carrier protein] ligase n=1 Tax=Longilinea arvoryzae TaxID=360412 RepID=A0A0S7BN89_9CHLR|nr:biotin--[acetyl-CoA-carboxylase] ligase [Longilinea arvoryzae]GAP15467.1 birA, biotin-[acetyl-CoA-carboxylase] ligase region [Longilinea arvoryzae]
MKDDPDETRLREQLQGLPLSEVRFSAETGSTNDDAGRWLETGAPDAAVVVTDCQIAGRGRLDRRWITRPGAALAFSLIFHPTPAEMEHLALFSPLAGLAVSDGLKAGCGLKAEIKWPNDVLLQRRKVCGILAETSWQAGRLTGVVLGIGVNVAPSAVPPADRLLFPAISVEEAAGHPVERWILLSEILASLFAWRKKLASPEFFQSWESRLAFKGEDVLVQMPDGQLEGKVMGIDPQGGLVLRTPAGKQEVITVGDVHLRPAHLPPAEQS